LSAAELRQHPRSAAQAMTSSAIRMTAVVISRHVRDNLTGTADIPTAKFAADGGLGSDG
jgi:hypothetical protein